MLPTPVHLAWRFVALTAVYILGTWYSEAFIVGPGQVTLFWPGAGVAFAAVLRYGWRWAAFIPGAVLAAHMFLAEVPPSFLPFSVLSNLVGALAGLLVVRASGVRPQVTLASGLAMFRGGVAMALVAAAIGTVGLLWSGMVTVGASWEAFVKWTLGDLLGIVCIFPGMLLLTSPPSSDPDMPRAAEYAATRERAAWVLLLVMAYLFVFWAGRENSSYALGMVAVPMALLVWSALRLPPVWTAIGTSTAIFFLTTLTGMGLAGFKSPVTLLDSALLLGFMIVCATVPLALVASVNEQRMGARRALRLAAIEAERQRIELELQVAERTRELHDANQRLELASLTDPLTGLRNRRYLTAQIPADLSFYDREQAHSGIPDNAMVLAMVDIDHFKRINDSLGHKAGDHVLQRCAERLQRLVRAGDYVVRWGGEEFLLVFRPVLRQHVPTLGERIRRCISDAPFELGDGRTVDATCSIGMAEYPLFHGADPSLHWEQMIELADAAMYWVKQNGRDGWATLRPTAGADLATLPGSFHLGASALIAEGSLEVVSSRGTSAVPS